MSTGFDAYRFMHCALPEIDLDEVSPPRRVRLAPASPLFVSCMTGGTETGHRINCVLAETAEELGMAMGLGSARVLLEHPEALAAFKVRRPGPVGASSPTWAPCSSTGVSPPTTAAGSSTCSGRMPWSCTSIPSRRLFRRRATPASPACSRASRALPAAGAPGGGQGGGLGDRRRRDHALLDAGVAAVDVAGAGGTSWSEVERHRLESRRTGWRAPSPTGASPPPWPYPGGAAGDAGVLFASGGVRDGVEVAKAVALGADLVGLAGPFLRAAAGGADACAELGREWVDVLRIADVLHRVGRDLASLRSGARLVRDDGGPVPGGADGVTLVTSLIETISDLRGTQVTRTATRG